MKLHFFKALAIAMLLLPSCSVKAQFNLGSLVTNLTSVFSADKQASSDNLIGTWEYTEPAILFQSDNVLAKAGAKIASQKIESAMQTHLNKYGIKAGALKLTFNEDGTFTEVLGTKNISGTWKVEDSKLLLTHANIKTITITTQKDGNTLMFVTDATKLLDLFKAFGSKSSNSNLKTITTLMKSINGMQAGLTLEKK